MEMIILMTIIGIIAAVAMPNAGSYIENNRMSAAVTEMTSTLQLARSESVGRNVPVSICAANANGTACNEFQGASNEWEIGWVVFLDPDADGLLDSGEEVIRFQDQIRGEITMRGTGFLEWAITFFPSGRTNIGATELIMICDERGYGDDARAVVVSILGRPSITKATDSGESSCDPS